MADKEKKVIRTIYITATLEKETLQACGWLANEMGHSFSFSAAVAEGLKMWNEKKRAERHEAEAKRPEHHQKPQK